MIKPIFCTHPGAVNTIDGTSCQKCNPRTDLVLCREIRFGKNGNFVRYQPVKFPDGIEILQVQTRSRFYPFVEKIFKIRGKRA